MAFNLNSFVNNAKSIASTASQTFGTISNSVNTLRTSGVQGILEYWNTGNKTSVTSAQFHQTANRDWRVRLSLPPGFESSALMTPLGPKGTNGLVFPYTPSIQIQHSANYQPMSPAHTNYQFLSYENSKIDSITITGEFFCEDSTEAEYWVGAVHYLRSVTKMFYGSNETNLGAPPPVVKLNGYGDYVFKDVPVVVTSFNLDLPKDVDYIATGLAQRSPTGDLLGDAINNLNLGLPAETGMAQGVAWAPVRSTITITVQPLYSRESIRKFSLDSFIKGEYVINGGGYL